MIFLCIGLMAAIFAGELYLKNRIEKRCKDGGTGELWKGMILIRKCYNRGAVLGVGQKKSRLVAALSVILTVAAFVCFLMSFGQRGNRLLSFALALLLGGAFSNTYDRLKRKYVVDYFSFGVKWKPLRNIVFNLSDFCIIIGAVLGVIAAS